MSSQLEKIQKDLPSVVQQSKALKITSPKELEDATELLSSFNRFNDALIADREKITKPLNEALKEVRAKYKPTETSLAEAIGIVRTKMGQYQMLLLAEQKKTADKLAKGELSLEDATLSVPVQKVATQSGSIAFKAIATLKITDAKKIPSKYLVPNEPLILADLKAKKKVPGCEIEMIQSVINRRK